MSPSRRVRRGSFAALALMLCGVTALAGALPAEAKNTAGRDRARARALALLDRVEDLTASTSAQRRSAAPHGDVTALLLELRRSRSALTRSELARATVATEDFVPPPRTSCASDFLGGYKALPSTLADGSEGHFCVHYKAGNEANASTAARELEYVWTREITGLGYRAPLSDGGGGFDVYLKDIGSEGYYGACSPSTYAAKSPASCVLDDDFAEFPPTAPINALRVTAAHEFFHAVQFAYDSYQQTWLMEGTAVWMEDVVYPSINDYLQYLPYSAIRHPGVSIDLNQSPWHYGAVIFWKYLSESLHDPAVIRQVWTYADAAYGRTALQSVRTMLSVRKRSFGTTFAGFAAWNTKPNGSYGDRRLFPAPAWSVVLTMARIGADSGWRRVVLNHLSSANSLVRPSSRLSTAARLKINIDGPSTSTAPVALVQLRLRTGAVRYLYVPLNGYGNGNRVVAFNRRTVAAVVVTMSNAGATNNQPFRIKLRVIR